MANWIMIEEKEPDDLLTKVVWWIPQPLAEGQEPMQSVGLLKFARFMNGYWFVDIGGTWAKVPRDLCPCWIDVPGLPGFA